MLKTENLGEINIPQKNIKSKTELKDIKKIGNEFWLPNPQSARYYWAPNGYGLKKGEGYYQIFGYYIIRFQSGLPIIFL